MDLIEVMFNGKEKQSRATQGKEGLSQIWQEEEAIDYYSVFFIFDSC
jgi:hypothetical protein